MTDEALSEAVIAYVWGDRSQPWPSRRPDALTEVQRVYLAAIEAIIATAFSVEPTAPTLASLGDEAAAAVRRGHPQLSPGALDAIGNLYAYQWK